MSKQALYTYNSETDNFERVYPSIRNKIVNILIIIVLSLLFAFLIFLLVFNLFATPTEKNLKIENDELRSKYTILSKRLDNTIKVMDRIRERDENFYRVIMQMEPARGPELINNNSDRYAEFNNLTDAALISELSKKIDILEREIYAQVQSFDQLKMNLEQQQARLSHIPGVLPIHIADYTMSSGYGNRIDPIYNTSRFHAGLDFAASIGTEIYATADGKVTTAGRRGTYGNCVDIDHGYNYLTRYAHMSEILVKEGESVKRGQLIGKVGSTGKSTGPHLHYEVRFKDEPQNPVNYYFLDLNPQEYSEMIQKAENAGHVMD